MKKKRIEVMGTGDGGGSAIAEEDCGGRGKRLKSAESMQPLLPGLPDHLAQLCLARLPAPLLYSTCRSWRHLLYSPSFPPFLSLYALLTSSPSPTPASGSDKNQDELGFFSFDPLSASWEALPPPPPQPPLHLLLHRHPAFIGRSLPIQSVSVSGHLLLLTGTDRRLLPALPRPLVFHPASAQWRLGPPIPAARRWCAAGAIRGAVYVASGVGSDYSSAVARSVERWNPGNLLPPASASAERWEAVAPLKDGRFSREAVEAVGSRGKLCMVNVRGKAAKEGVVYDVDCDRWEEMPEGLLAGWTGPAAAMDDEVIYVVDEATGELREYDWEGDCWRFVVQSDHLKGSSQIAAAGSRVCAVQAGGSGIAVVDVAATAAGPSSLWTVKPPAGMQVVDVHVLPRMSRPDCL